MRSRKKLSQKEAKFRKNFESSLAILRVKSGHTQESLAKAIGVSTNTLQNYESGTTCPDISIVYEICCKCGVTLNYFFPKDKEDKNALMSRISKLDTKQKKLLETYVDLLEQM